MPNLLLLNISGARYGVWEDAVPSVIDAVPLHQLPLSPPVIAGIAILEDRSAVIADLGACLGHPPLASPRDGTFLIIDANDKIVGFCVEGRVEGFECPPEHVLSVPLAVSSPVADTCAVRGSSLIPIINIRNLHDRLKQGLLDLPFPEPGPPARASDLSGVHRVRIFSVGNARFCVNAEVTDYAVLGEGGVAPLPIQSGRVAGVALYDGAAVPVMLPGSFNGFANAAGRKGILLAGSQGARYGVIVDQELGVLEGPDLTVLALPKLVARPWLPAAALAKGKICLLVDSNLFTAPEDPAVDQPEQTVFTPASQFPMQFRKVDAAIVEFSLLGTRHAVPQEEMKEDLALLPIVPVPGTPELVLGVAEHRGALLPVLDLAALFGRRSLIGKKSRMMHIVNGDFQALVITDKVAGSRRLPVATQRQVPIALPHQVLYGCYLDAGMVRLIMNVEALAVHFEKTAVRELVASLSPELMETHELEMEAAPTSGLVESSVPADRPADSSAGALTADQEQARAAVPSATEFVQQPEENAGPGQDVETGPAEEDSRSRAVEQARLKDEADAQIIEAKGAQEEAERVTAEAAALARAETEARALEQEVARRKAAEDAAMAAAEEVRKQTAEESRRKAEDLAREAAADAARRAAAEEAEQQRTAEEAERQAAEEARVRAENEARKQEEAAQQQAAAAVLKREDAERQAEEQARSAAAESAQREADEARQRKEKESEERAAYVALVKHRMMQKQQAEPKFTPEPGPEKDQPGAGKSMTYFGIAALTVLLLALVIYFGNRPKRPELQVPSVPEKTGKQTATQKSAPQPEKEPPLYLTVPPGKALSEPFTYTVVKGDNLWNIAKRFTGNPLNYPRVARDNSIATPALIFPGQKIRLMQQAADGTGPQTIAPSSN